MSDTVGASPVSDTISLPADSPLRRLAESKPALVVFLRSFNCTFCREALADVAAVQEEIAADANIVFVHVEPADEADPWFEKYGLGDVVHVSDPSRAHYLAFGLDRTKTSSIVSPAVWTRGASCALRHGFGVQNYEMMRRQPGVFLVRGSRILAGHRHATPSDRPDYLRFVRSGKTLLQ